MRRLKEKFPNELVVIGVHSAKFPTEGQTENIGEAARRHGIEHPVVNDAGFKIWNSFNVHAWPTLVFIDPNGEVIGAQPGEINAEDFIPLIERMVAQYTASGDLDLRPVDVQPLAGPRRPLSYPSKLLVTPQGRLYVADTGNHRVLELSFDPDKLSAKVERVFGSGRPGLQDGPAAQAAFHHPRGLAVSGDRLYVADSGNHAVRAIDLAGEMVRTVAGTGERGAGRRTQGSPTEIELRSPWALLALPDATEDGQDVLFIAMAGSHQIWILLGEERLGVFAGNGREALVDGPLAEASFNQPSDLALGMGHLLVADAEASAIRAIALTEEPRVVTLVGQGLFEFGDVDGRGADVRLQHASGIAFSDGANYVYIADSYNHKIKRLDPTSGEVLTLVGTGESGLRDGSFERAELHEPEGLALYEGRLFIADTNNHLLRVADLAAQQVHTVTLRGLEKLQPPPTAASELGLEPVEQRLEEVSVQPGEVTFAFDFLLPAGYKLNPEAPSTIAEVENCGGEAAAVHAIPKERGVRVSTRVEQDCELELDLTLYYCEQEDERLCLIHDRQLVLPVRVEADAPAEAHLIYSV